MRRVLPLLPVTLVLAACSTDPSTSLAPSSAPSLAAASSVSNAQSIMVSLQLDGPFLIQGEKTYEFDKDEAATYFTNVVTSGPIVTCAGNATNCALANKPAQPAVPAVDPNEVKQVLGPNGCTFWDGGDLSVKFPQSTYKRSVTLNGLNGNGNWKFEWTYTVATTATVAGETAWDLVSSTGGFVNPSVSGSIYGLSTQARTGGAGNWGLKASFSMADPAGTRVSGLTATVYDVNNVVVGAPVNPGTTLGLPFDVLYVPNAGTFGASGQLFENANASQIVMGVAFANDLMRRDDFKGNDSDLAEPANILSTGLGQLTAAGDYVVKLTGSVKSNSVTGFAQTFSTSESLKIYAGTCADPLPTP
jgi:hypothetical protein